MKSKVSKNTEDRPKQCTDETLSLGLFLYFGLSKIEAEFSSFLG